MLVTILKNEEIEVDKKSPPTHPPIHIIKHFGILVSGAGIDNSSTLHGTDWIKDKILKWTPYRISAFADSLRGVKRLLFNIQIKSIDHTISEKVV